MPSVGIIGTAGRKGTHVKLSLGIFKSMVAQAEQIITEQLHLSWNTVHLVSGGAAWADHVAVMTYMAHQDEDCSLTLHLPCEWTKKGFADTGERDWRVNPGRTANHYHNLFSKMVERDTLYDIEFVSQLGATLDCDAKGFNNRNSAIAKADYLIAFTWAKDKPEEGGTLDTWKKSNGIKIHVSLSELLLKESGVEKKKKN